MYFLRKALVQITLLVSVAQSAESGHESQRVRKSGRESEGANLLHPATSSFSCPSLRLVFVSLSAPSF